MFLGLRSLSRAREIASLTSFARNDGRGISWQALLARLPARQAMTSLRVPPSAGRSNLEFSSELPNSTLGSEFERWS